jgi:hypothetical protein
MNGPAIRDAKKQSYLDPGSIAVSAGEGPDRAWIGNLGLTHKSFHRPTVPILGDLIALYGNLYGAPSSVLPALLWRSSAHWYCRSLSSA